MRRLLLAVFGLLVLVPSPVAAQIVPTTTTTAPDATTSSSTTSTSLDLTTTTTSFGSTTSSTLRSTTTTRRRTTSSTTGKSTTTTELRSTNTFVPPEGRRGGGTSTTLPFRSDTTKPGDRYLGLMVVLSLGGFGAVALMIGARLVATRPAAVATRSAKRAGPRPAPSPDVFFDDEDAVD